MFEPVRIPRRLAIVLLVASALPGLVAAVLSPEPTTLFVATLLGAWLVLGIRITNQTNGHPPQMSTVRVLLLGLMSTVAMNVSDDGGYAVFSAVAATVCVVGLQLPLMMALVSCGLIMLAIAPAVYTSAGSDGPAALSSVAANVVAFFAFARLLRQSIRAKAESDALALELAEASRLLQGRADAEVELARTKERERIAHELHDSLGHALAALHVNLQAAGRSLASQDPAQASVGRAEAIARRSLNELRETVSAMRKNIRIVSLEQALRRLAEDLAEGHLAVDVEVVGKPSSLKPQVALGLYRVAQEALSNTMRHASAKHVILRLEVTPTDTVRLQIEDDGCGADPGRVTLGLASMRNRIEQLQGTLDVHTMPGEGFAVTAQVPL